MRREASGPQRGSPATAGVALRAVVRCSGHLEEQGGHHHGLYATYRVVYSTLLAKIQRRPVDRSSMAQKPSR